MNKQTEADDLEATYRVLETMRDDESLDNEVREMIEEVHYQVQLYEEWMVTKGIMTEAVK